MLQGIRLIRQSGRGLNICLEDLEGDFEAGMRLILAECGVAPDSARMACLLEKTRFLDPRAGEMGGHSTKSLPGYRAVKARLIEHLRNDTPLWGHLMEMRAMVGCHRRGGAEGAG
mmetsp:Transcript_77695/g.240768  ORF Transcript_77695/g.240768 Transcript_77695/m.240768 type:complete len:115 (+) Transcript_77695:476-820(+)